MATMVNQNYQANAMPMDEMTHNEPKVGAEVHEHETFSEILEHLANHDMIDELQVCNKYLNYAECLYARGKYDLSEKFVEMAYEEYTHAKFQEKVLLENGYSLDDHGTALFHETKMRFNAMFRN